MAVTYTKTLARKIILIFLIVTIVFAVTALIVQKNISQKLNDVSKLATNVQYGQSKPEQALLLLHQAEDDFQEALLNTNGQKIASYKAKLFKAFNDIDTMLREKPKTTDLTKGQDVQVNTWYKKKVNLSDRLYTLRRSFDSLLTVYTNLNEGTAARQDDLNKGINFHRNKVEHNTSDTSKKAIAPKKGGLFKRLKEAISNKNTNYNTEITHNNNTQQTDLQTQKMLSDNRNAYTKKLQNLQQHNAQLLAMQRELNRLNSYISSELEGIINQIKDINYNMALGFKETALKNYRETTDTLNKFYIIALFLLIAFAASLIIFIYQLNKAGVALRREGELSVHTAQQKIDELLKRITREEDHHSPVKKEELTEVVELAIQNNPAFLIKFNEFDPQFGKTLLNIAPTLVASEIEFCALLKLNFDTKEIARYTKSSVRAVEGKKYRIRKKLDIPSDHDINIWMTRV